LGVDTVKQAEMFAAIREIYNIPRDENRKLRDYPTLAHVLRFVYEQRPDLAGRAPGAVAGCEPPKTVETAVVTHGVAAAPSPIAAAPAGAALDAIQQKVLDIVAEKTGYPKEMLDLDLDLEADLGIDTVKQAEMFASVRAAYNIPRDENMKLRDFPTLAHVIKFAQDRANPTLSPTAGERMGHPAGNGPTAVTPMPTAETAPIGNSKPTFTAESIAEKVLEIVAEKTGYPKEMLDLDLDLEADLGIDTVKQAEMFASVRAAYNIPRDENMKLRDFPTLAHV